MWVAIPLLAVGIAVVLGHAFINARQPAGAAALAAGAPQWKWIATATILRAVQPIARILGRASGQRRFLRPVRRLRGWRLPKRCIGWIWSDAWLAPEIRIAALEAELGSIGVPLTRGGSYDGWDLEIHGGLFGGARLSVAVEDHSGAAQMVRYRLVPSISAATAAAVLLLIALAIVAAADAAWWASFALGCVAASIAAATILACGRAVAWGLKAIWVLGK
jgi:hypothetical protein